MDFLLEYDETLSPQEVVALLRDAEKQIWRSCDNRFERSASESDAALLRQLAVHENPEIRAASVKILSSHGPVTWEDVERWLADVNACVRDVVWSQLMSSHNAVSDLPRTDPERFVGVFAVYARARHSVPSEAWYFAHDYQDFADLLWSHLGPLLDEGNAELNSDIICGVLEDFLVYHRVEVDGPQVQSWIRGDSVERKMALLSVVQWFGMKEPWQREIAEQLADDSSDVVSSTAKSFLAGQGVPDIQCRKWA